MAADAAGPFAVAALVEGRMKADVFDQLARVGKALDVADDRSQGEGDQVAHAAEPYDR